jgi:DNA-binding NtrC family response regulator
MKVLVVDDEENVRKGIATFLALSGHEAVGAVDLAAARAALLDGDQTARETTTIRSTAPFGAALVDVYVGREDGASLLDFAAERRLRVPVIMMSGRGSVKDAVAAVRKGAYDFLEKPLDTDRLLSMLRNLEREAGALRKLDAFRAAWLEEHVYLREGSALASAFDSARRTACSPLSILVSGPTGSGKELVARWIHLCSPRSQGPFVAVNCAAIPPGLGESAFFGSRKGSYTGAGSDRPGYFEAATGGTLFLDEVGEIGLGLQAALLRAVETGEIQPVGAERACRADARIVAATNRDLPADVASGRFREDLYWRLAQAQVSLPSLADRRDEIAGLAEFLALPIRSQIGSGAPRIGQDAISYLESRPWPGNVRELRAFLERALWLAPADSLLDASYLAGLEPSSRPPKSWVEAVAPGAGPPSPAPALTNLAEAKEAFEREYVGRAIEAAGGSISRAAELLGLLPNNLSRKLKDLGIRRGV